MNAYSIKDRIMDVFRFREKPMMLQLTIHFPMPEYTSIVNRKPLIYNLDVNKVIEVKDA